MSVQGKLSMTLALLLVPLGYLSPEVNAQRSRKETELKLTLISASRLRFNDQFKLTVLLENIGDRDIFVSNRLRWNYLGNLMFFIIDSKGRQVNPKLSVDEPPGPAAENMSDYLKLRPGLMFGTTYFASLKDMNLRPGKYSVVVQYRSLESVDDVKVAPFFGSEDGIIESNAVEVKIVADR